MLFLAVLISSLAAQDLAPRIDVLEKHLDRLEAIALPDALKAEKAAKLKTLRDTLEAGPETTDAVNRIYREMDAVRSWLLKNAAAPPVTFDGGFEETDSAWTLYTPALKVTIDRNNLAMTALCAGKTWRFKACDSADIRGPDIKADGFRDAASRTAEPFRTGYSQGVLIHLREFPDQPDLEFILGVHLTGNEMRCTLTAPGDAIEFNEIQWPKPIETGNSANDMAVIPMMQGILLPGTWEQKLRRKELVNSRTLSMPWFGQLQAGDGVLTIYETPDDAGVQYMHDPQKGTTIEALWYSSLRKVRYPRRIRYIFGADQNHVTMAKRYRRHVREAGRFVSLEEKRIRNPRLEKVIGHPVVHIGALYHYVQESNYYNKEKQEANHQLQTFEEIEAKLRNLKDAGVDAYVHLDGWGYYGYDNGHPDVVPVGEEQGGWEGLKKLADTLDDFGWVLALHDQYRDFYLNAASFDRRLAKLNRDGSYDEHAIWCGGAQTILSAVHAPGYVRRNHDWLAAHGIDIKGAYLDVFAVVPLEESYHPEHPMTRTDCLQYRKQCFDLLRARDYVISSEEPVDMYVPTLDLVHHGPWFMFEEGKEWGIPAPLFDLVYHDSILLPWTTSEAGGWGIPEKDAGRLHCLLHAGLPYVNPGRACGEDPESDAYLARIRECIRLAQRCGTVEMTNHEFLGDSWRRQRSTFADGTAVTVNFDTKAYEITHANPPLPE
jgi:hypothetical protein